MGARVWLVFAVLTVVVAASQPGLAAVCDRPLRIGWNHWPPYQTAGGGAPGGIDAEVVASLADATGCRVEWVRAPWRRQLELLADGELDAVMTANHTPERARYGVFSEPYLHYRAILWTAQPLARRRFTSLRTYLEAGHRVGIVRGYTYGPETDTVLEAPSFRDQVVINNTLESNVLMLANGRLHGLLGNRLTVSRVAAQTGVAEAIHPTDLIVQDEPVHILWSRQAVADSVIQAWNRAIRRQREDGVFRSIRARHRPRSPGRQRARP